MHREPRDPAASASALKFFDWAYKNGAHMAEQLDYVPMPQNVVELVEQTWAKDFVQVDGEALWGGTGNNPALGTYRREQIAGN